jgi:choice-of-anchor A domain-containing protein
MRALRGLILAILTTCTSLAPAIASASEPHSWCVTGEKLVQSGSTDPDTNTIIAYVCNVSGGGKCCTDRWSLSCVQAAAEYARNNNLKGGDFCGRYQWVQGPLPNTRQYYPRDFNLMAVSAPGILGDITGLRDVEDPVAASRNITINYFSLNNKQREPVALVGDTIVLNSGTVKGSVIYGTSYRDAQVTYAPGFARPTAATNPLPINFAAASNAYKNMSLALKAYDSIPVTKSGNSITFTGNDPEMNVFSADGSTFSGITSYYVRVPAGAAVIINVSGKNPIIQYAGFDGVQAGFTLWNFHEAQTLQMKSVGFPGSVLAPLAAANLMNGSAYGTIVVAAAKPANIELYSAPLQLFPCTGCLCGDPTWSCSYDTAVDRAGHAVALQPEAGFLEIAGGNYWAQNATRTGLVQRTSPTHRIWYSFQPASVDALKKPLAVLFNGGPGAATSTGLFVFNTGPYTINSDAVGATPPYTVNTSSWTQFANLLYVDGPSTGFSYPLANADGSKPDIGIDMDHDAAIFLRFLARFLVRHPMLFDNRVVIVAESYGGIRATLMFSELFNYSSLTDSNAPYQDSLLSNDLATYFLAAFSTRIPNATKIRSRFGHQVLIQPAIGGEEERSYRTGFPWSNCIQPDPNDGRPNCVGTDQAHPQPLCDRYHCKKPPNWTDDRIYAAGTNLTNLVSTLSMALGVSAPTIEWMRAATRTTAYGRRITSAGSKIVPDSDAMVKIFGGLTNDDDSYLLIQNNLAFLPYGLGTPSAAMAFSDDKAGLYQGTSFVTDVANGVTSFITVAKYDYVVYSPAIPLNALQVYESDATFKSLVSSVSYDATFSNGLSLPGAMTINYTSSQPTVVVMPTAYDAGHALTLLASSELLSDVNTWYQASPH